MHFVFLSHCLAPQLTGVPLSHVTRESAHGEKQTQMKSPEERQAKEKREILIVISFPALLCRETYLFLIYLPPFFFFFFEIRSDSVAWCDLKFTT